MQKFGRGKNIDGTKNLAANQKTDGDGINIKPSVLNNGETQQKLVILYYLFKTLMMLMLRLLIGCFQLVFKVFRIFIGR